ADIQGESKMSLKPFTYPLPETRFLHAGRLVYKFKIQYGNFSSVPDLDNTERAVKELEKQVHVAATYSCSCQKEKVAKSIVRQAAAKQASLLVCFAKDLSKWERVSKMRFKHENVHLVPYPYICTMYLELNSFQQNMSCGKDINKASYERAFPRKVGINFYQYRVCNVLKVKKRNEMSESHALKETMKRKRVEVSAESSCPQSGLNRTGAECVHRKSKAKHGFEMWLNFPNIRVLERWSSRLACWTLRRNVVGGRDRCNLIIVLADAGRHVLSYSQNSFKENGCEFSPASLTTGCNQVSSWRPVESTLEQRAATGQAEGTMQLLQQVDQMTNKGNMESEGRSLSKFWRR
ncbi:hypothetical protein Q9233_010458, partial [Columba guinea]